MYCKVYVICDEVIEHIKCLKQIRCFNSLMSESNLKFINNTVSLNLPEVYNQFHANYDQIKQSISTEIIYDLQNIIAETKCFVVNRLLT